MKALSAASSLSTSGRCDEVEEEAVVGTSSHGGLASPFVPEAAVVAASVYFVVVSVLVIVGENFCNATEVSKVSAVRKEISRSAKGGKLV